MKSELNEIKKEQILRINTDSSLSDRKEELSGKTQKS